MLAASVDCAWLNEASEPLQRPAETVEAGTKMNVCALPTSAEIGLKPKAAPAAKTLLSPAPWTGLHHALFSHDVVNEPVVTASLDAAPAAVVVPSAAAEESKAPTHALPQHDFIGGQRRAERRGRTDSTESTCSWSGISASLEDDFGGSPALGSPIPVRHTANSTAAPPAVPTSTAPTSAATSMVSANEIMSQPASLRRPPKLSKLQPAQPQSWAGLADEMQDMYSNPSPSPRPRRPSREAKPAPQSTSDSESKENGVSNDAAVAGFTIAGKAPPSTAFGYADLSPLALLSH